MTLFEFMKTDTFNEKNAAQLFMIITTDILKKTLRIFLDDDEVNTVFDSPEVKESLLETKNGYIEMLNRDIKIHMEGNNDATRTT